MNIFGALLLVLGVCVAHAHAQDARLPPPTAASGESETLIQRAVSLFAARNYRESAAVWQTVAAREPIIGPLANRESIRALIAAGDIEVASKGITELGSAAPSDLILRAADACRAAASFDCAITMYRRARETAGRTRAADEA